MFRIQYPLSRSTFWTIFAGIGALIGTEPGAHHFSRNTIRYVLAVVLIIAGFKMIYTTF